MINQQNSITLIIPQESAGLRLDVALSQALPEHSRAAIQGWLKRELVLVDGTQRKANSKLLGGEEITLQVPEPEPITHNPEAIDLAIVYQDDSIIVLNKPANLVVHPGAGNHTGTLLNGLLHHFPDLANLPRAGIVHRLDKDTTGLMVVAKTERARQSLIEQLKTHSVHRQYLALAVGSMVAGETIDQPIARHRQDRLKMAVVHQGKEAVTHLRLVEKFSLHSLVRARLETGRTHQIRVHMAWRHWPLVGDSLYGGRLRFPKGASEETKTALRDFQRQALHAEELALIHPESGETMSWRCALPDDYAQLLQQLRLDRDQEFVDLNG